jgi:hypothetical protein
VVSGIWRFELLQSVPRALHRHPAPSQPYRNPLSAQTTEATSQSCKNPAVKPRLASALHTTKCITLGSWADDPSDVHDGSQSKKLCHRHSSSDRGDAVVHVLYVRSPCWKHWAQCLLAGLLQVGGPSRPSWSSSRLPTAAQHDPCTYHTVIHTIATLPTLMHAPNARAAGAPRRTIGV